MDFDEMKKQADDIIDNMCDKNGYDKEYIKNSTAASFEGLKDDDGNIDVGKLNGMLSDLNVFDGGFSGMMSFLTPEMLEQSMRMAGMLFNNPAKKNDDENQSDKEYNDVIIEE